MRRKHAGSLAKSLLNAGKRRAGRGTLAVMHYCHAEQKGAHHALCACCAKRRQFSTPGSHGSPGPEFCTPDAVLNGSCTLLLGGGLQGCSRDKQRNHWRCAHAVRALCENAPEDGATCCLLL